MNEVAEIKNYYRSESTEWLTETLHARYAIRAKQKLLGKSYWREAITALEELLAERENENQISKLD